MVGWHRRVCTMPGAPRFCIPASLGVGLLTSDGGRRDWTGDGLEKLGKPRKFLVFSRHKNYAEELKIPQDIDAHPLG